MLSLTLGLGLILVGAYFNNLFTVVVGFFCMVLGLYSSKAKPIEAKESAQARKVTHRIIVSEPPESTIMPSEMRGLPIDISDEIPDFLPLPDYGYSDPLEKIFVGFPIRFLKKV